MYIYSTAASRDNIGYTASGSVTEFNTANPTAQITRANTVTPSPSPTRITPAKVLIDPGHGGDDCGAQAESPYINEKIINMTIASRLYNLLRQDSEKILVQMTRYDETTVSKPDRVDMANTSSDFFISIHCNTNANPLARGISTYFQTHEGKDTPFTSKELAEAIQRHLTDVTGSHDRGIEYSDKLYLLNHTSVPTVIVEVGFLTNAEELLRLLDDNYVDLLAEGLRQGILEMAERVIASNS